MGSVRAACRVAAIVLWSAVAGLMSLPYQLGRGWKRIERVSHFTCLWDKGIARIIGLRIHVHGPLPPPAGALVVSNHVSYLDVVTHGAILPVRYAPKKEIAAWPVLGWYLGLSRPIWTDRGSKRASQRALRQFVKTMKRGMCLVVYPEGTTTDGKSGILPFKSTAFEAATVGGVPVVPALTRYRGRGAGGIAWYGDMTLLPHAWELLKRRSIDVDVYFLEPVYPDGRARKEFARRVHDLMEREWKRLEAQR